MMSRLEKAAVIISFIEELNDKGSWCGETHIQKSMYFLQELTGVPMGFNFILYKHGPFSFDFRDELTGMRADWLLEVHIRPNNYGPSLLPSSSGKNIRDHFLPKVKKYHKKMEFVAAHLGEKSVVELERLGTALYVTLKMRTIDQLARATEINRLKPHVSIDTALMAVQEFDNIKNEFNRSFNN